MNYFIEVILRLTTIITLLIFILTRGDKNQSQKLLFFFNLFVIVHGIFYAIFHKFNYNFSIAFNLTYVPIEFLLIVLFFNRIFYTPLNKRILIVLSLLFFGTFFIRVLSPNYDYENFDSVINGLESIITLTLSLLYFYQELRNTKSVFIYTQPVFWGVSGFLILFSGSLFVFLFRQTSSNNEVFLNQYMYIHALSGIVKNLFFAIAIVIKPKEIALLKIR